MANLLMDAEFMVSAPSGTLQRGAALARFHQLKTALANEGIGKLAVIVKCNQALIGYCGVESCWLDGRQEVELGYRISKSARGLGYATEAAQAVLGYYKKSGLSNIVAFTEPENCIYQCVKKIGISGR